MTKPLLSALTVLALATTLWFRFPHEAHVLMNLFGSSQPVPQNAVVLVVPGMVLVLSGTHGPGYAKPAYIAGKCSIKHFLSCGSKGLPLMSSLSEGRKQSVFHVHLGILEKKGKDNRRL